MTQRIINATPCRSIGCAPYRLLFGDRAELNRGVIGLNKKMLSKGEKHSINQKESFGKEKKKLTYKNKEGGSTGHPQHPQEEKLQAFIENAENMQEKILKASQKYQEEQIKKACRAPTLGGREPNVCKDIVVGDYVLSTYGSGLPNKLSSRWRGPLLVVDIEGSSLYYIQDLLSFKIYKVHISRLKLFNMDLVDDPRKIAQVDINEWLVEAIVDHRFKFEKKAKLKERKGKKAYEFRVRWDGFGPEDDSWLPYSEVRDLIVFADYVRENSLRL